jgi:epoxyqueuosine reductase
MGGMHQDDPRELKNAIRALGGSLGFARVGFAAVNLGMAESRLMDWLARGYHGSMDYMARHGVRRARPTELVPGTRSVISVRLDYGDMDGVDDPSRAMVSRYARGRDYHKVLRQRLQTFADRLVERLGPFQYRAFTDSAPVMEVELARLAGLGWRGKHTLLLSRAGSWFFLGELYTDLDIPADAPETGHCGTCQACLDVCPTRAFVAPYILDARRCISYLTIEHGGPIPEALRPMLGNRVYGCDDCQAICPWNRFAAKAEISDFLPRQGLDQASLVELFLWSEAEFFDRLAGSPIRRIGHDRWLRNLAVALGNGPANAEAVSALRARAGHSSALVREHVAWALARLLESGASSIQSSHEPKP